MERSNDSNVIDMINDWREETLDLEALLHSSTANQTNRNDNGSLSSTAPSSTSNVESIGLPAYPNKVTVPTFSSANTNRPSVLDLSTTMRYQERPRMLNNNMNGHSQQMQQRSVSPHQQAQSPHSPHHSPYTTNNPAQQVFNYNTGQDQHSPVSPHAGRHIPPSPVSPRPHDQPPLSPHHMSGSVSPVHMQQAPVSPHSPYSTGNRGAGAVSPMSPHHPHQGMVSPGPHSPHPQMAGGMSPHHPGLSPHPGAMSPHHGSHSGSVSPVPRQLSPAPGASSVFGRYAGSPVSMHSGNESDTDSFYNYQMEMRKRGIHVDKNSDMYKAKRERNNIAVRKSREKKKAREQETEKRVKELSEENANLQNKLDVALKEMNLLKNLYKSIGVQLPPEAKAKLENELSKFK